MKSYTALLLLHAALGNRTRLLCFVTLIAGTALLPMDATAARCGGTERWAVKVAADDAASRIDAAAIEDVTVRQLNGIVEPTDLPRDEDTRHPSEKRVLRVTGRLVEYRNEADKDYHLIITDDSRKFTQGGTKTKPTGTSFIAEIPHPDCVPGKKLALSTKSHFETQLREVRRTFDQGPAADIGPKKELDVPVRITGLAFFDRPHGQTGRAKNNLEIHPILNIEFLDEDADAPEVMGVSPSRPVDLIQGGEFEDRVSAWTISDPDVIRLKAYPDADQVRGRGRAQLGGMGIAGQNSLRQNIAIPATARSVELRFRMRIKTEEAEDDRRVLDTMMVQVRTTSGQTLKTLFTFSNRDSTQYWKPYSADLAAFRGRSIQLHFEGKEDRGLATFFWIDAVKVLVTE